MSSFQVQRHRKNVTGMIMWNAAV